MRLMILIIGLFGSISLAEFYKLSNVKRIDQNLYKYDGGYIATKYCYEYTYGVTVIYNDNTREIIFDSGNKCSVDKFFQ